MIPVFINKNSIPHKPGVYQFYDKSGRILYVGKAIDLYHRVASYFNSRQQAQKTEDLVRNIASCKTIEVRSELEALILEANLIKKYLPPYNIRLTDDKDYLYIKVTKGEFPQIITARKKELSDHIEYFGPFPSGQTVRMTLKKLRRVFPWCSSPPKSDVRLQTSVIRKRLGFLDSEAVTNTQQRPCFYYHLRLCPGACVGKISAKEYRQNIKNFIKFMQGKNKELIEDLGKKMKEASDAKLYERAQAIKKTIEGISYVLQSSNTQVYLENPNFLEDQRQGALLELKDKLNLPTIPSRVECFDISNIQGINATGSMVVLTDGDIDKSQYRKFKIQISGHPNDFAMMSEMVNRRLKHSEWPKPDLILIDGGRGQVRVALGELNKKGWHMPIYGLAKRMEWLYSPGQEVIKLPKSSLSLRLLQTIRDEAHRFALKYHLKLRELI